jgi:hypothetical protein
MLAMEVFSIVGGTLVTVTVLHFVVFWLSRWMYPPVKKVTFQPPPVQYAPIPSPLNPPPPPMPPSQSMPPHESALQRQFAPPDLPPRPMVQPPVGEVKPPSTFTESVTNVQVPVADHGPLPPPIQVGKQRENDA